MTGEGQGARREVRGARGEKRGAGSEDAEQSAEERKPLASRPARKRAASRLACSPSPNKFETTWGLERSHLESSGDFFFRPRFRSLTAGASSSLGTVWGPLGASLRPPGRFLGPS